MGKLLDDIKNAKLNGHELQTTEILVIENTLNKMFYAKPNIVEEVKLLNLLMTKNGYDKDRAGLHASAIIVSENEFCYREQVLSLIYKMEQGDNIPISLRRIFEEGNAIHEKWQKLFVRSGLGIAENMDRSRFNKRYELTYSPDATNVLFNKKEYVVEIKSMNMFAYQKATSHPSGAKQLKLYMHFTKCFNGFVLAEDKNTQQFKVFPVEYDYNDIAPYVERLEKVQEYKYKLLEEHKMVPRKCTKIDCKRAQTCNMRDACWNVGKGRVKLGA